MRAWAGKSEQICSVHTEKAMEPSVTPEPSNRHMAATECLAVKAQVRCVGLNRGVHGAALMAASSTDGARKIETRRDRVG